MSDERLAETAEELAEKVRAAIALRVPKWGGATTADARAALDALLARLDAVTDYATAFRNEVQMTGRLNRDKAVAEAERNEAIMDGATKLGQAESDAEALAQALEQIANAATTHPAASYDGLRRIARAALAARDKP